MSALSETAFAILGELLLRTNGGAMLWHLEVGLDYPPDFDQGVAELCEAGTVMFSPQPPGWEPDEATLHVRRLP